MSAPCIYHDNQPSITLCPGCDFGVCQQCMDEGAEGVCATCAEERAVRRESSAVQREYEAAEAVSRCNYCRVASDESTPLDEHGYCEACQALPRCTTHQDLVAVGHCKGCRQEFCRKCLGFTDVCQACTAKQKVRPKKPAGATPRPESAPARPAGARPAGTRKRPAPPDGAAPKRKKRPPQAGPDEAAPKKKKPPTRGEAALKEKLEAKNAGKTRMQVVLAGVCGALVLLVLLSGMVIRAMSPEEQAKHTVEEMLVVHQAVVHYYKIVGELPNTPKDIYRSLASMKVKNYRSIKIGASPGEVPGGVVYNRTKHGGFIVSGADAQGQSLKANNGTILSFDDAYRVSR